MPVRMAAPEAPVHAVDQHVHGEARAAARGPRRVVACSRRPRRRPSATGPARATSPRSSATSPSRPEVAPPRRRRGGATRGAPAHARRAARGTGTRRPGGPRCVGGVAVAEGRARAAPSRRAPRVVEQARGLGDDRRRSVPTSGPPPASTPSGRSVTSRSTSTGLPSAGASSWMPPESVRTSVGAVQQPDELRVVERLDEAHVRAPAAAPAPGPAPSGSGAPGRRSPTSGKRARERLRWPRQIARSGAPKLSRRWAVTSTRRSRRIERRERRGAGCRQSPRTVRSSASIDGVAGDEDAARPARPRRAGARAALGVGGEVQRRRRASMTTRFISSGNGASCGPVRSPASTWPTGTCAVERRQRRGERGRRVALDQDHVGTARRAATAARARSTRAATSAGVWPGASGPGRRPGTGRRAASTWSSISRCCAVTQTRARSASRARERRDDRGHLDGLGAGAEGDEDALHGAASVRGVLGGSTEEAQQGRGVLRARGIGARSMRPRPAGAPASPDRSARRAPVAGAPSGPARTAPGRRSPAKVRPGRGARRFPW